MITEKQFKEFSELYLNEVNLPFYNLMGWESVTKDFIEKLKEMGEFIKSEEKKDDNRKTI